MPIDKRLQLDFQEPAHNYRHQPYLLELPASIPRLQSGKPKTVEEIISRGISSPKELIVELPIDKKTMDYYTLTPKRRHRRPKSHITHKVYKKKTSSTSSKSSRRSKSRTRSMRKSL
jgi:hypothetical protein